MNNTKMKLCHAVGSIAFIMISLFFCPQYMNAQSENLNNNLLKFGTGSGSIDLYGNLLVPSYMNNSNVWSSLTHSGQSLSCRYGVSGDGTEEWNLTGVVISNPRLTDMSFDISNYVSEGSDIGYGSLIVRGTVTIDNKALGIEHKYEMGEGQSYIKVTTRITNNSGESVSNLRYWVGAPDDQIGRDDSPSKVKGNLIDGEFVKISNQEDRSNALKITSDLEGVLFFTNSSKANNIIGNSYGWQNVIGQNPTTCPIEKENSDDSYGFYVRMNDLGARGSDEFSWFYAAGEVGNLGDIIANVAAASVDFSDISSSGVNLNVSIPTDGMGYWMVIPRNALAPTDAQIKAGIDYADVKVVAFGRRAMVADEETTFTVAGLPSGSDYDLYFVSENVENEFSSIASSQFSTAPTTSLSGGTGGTASYTNVPVKIASEAVLTGTTLSGLYVLINENYVKDEDFLGIDSARSGTIGDVSYSFDSAIGSLSFTGTADVATYQSIIRQITYINTSTTPDVTPRKITISLNSALPFYVNGHYYEYVSSPRVSWAEAKVAAESRSYFGLQGYLITITSVEEGDFCKTKLLGAGWLGASDEATEGIWKWVGGPEKGLVLDYSNWNYGEPNNAGNEDCAQFLSSDGKWNDLPSSSRLNGYVVEYGGMEDNLILDLSDEVIVNFSIPVALAATDIKTTSIQANWRGMPGVTNYCIDVAKDASFTNILTAYNNKALGDLTSYMVSGLNDFTNYFYRVRATTSIGSGFNSPTIEVITKTKHNQLIFSNLIERKKYGDVAFNLTASSSSNLPISYSSSDETIASVSGSVLTIVGAGNVTITASQAGNDTYFKADDVDRELTISKAVLFVIAEGKSRSYGDNNPELTFKYSGFLNDDTSLDTDPSLSTVAGKNSVVGVYSINIEGASDDNYDFIYVPSNLTVSKARLIATADAQTKVYGEANPELTFKYSGFVNEETDVLLDSKPSISTLADKTSNVGTYPINLEGASDDNYDFTYVANKITVSKADLKLIADAKSKVYGEENSKLTYHFSGFVNGDIEPKIIYDPSIYTSASKGSDVGEYPIFFEGGVARNYILNNQEGIYTVTKAGLKIIADAQTKVYGEANPELTFKYSGFVNEETDVLIDSKPSISTLADKTSKVGTYAINLEGGLDDNYDLIYVPNKITVSKARLIATADAQTKVYGEANPELTFKYSGWKNDDASIDTDPSLSTLADKTSNVGTYPINLEGASDDNYDFTYVANKITVSKARLIATADAQTKVYGEANPELTFKYSGFANGEESIDTDPSLSTLADNTSVVGTYAINLEGALDDNYDFTYVPNKITVSKAILTITADAQTKVYGEANPELTCKCCGYVCGDTDTNVDKKPCVNTLVDKTSKVGTYSIDIAGGLDDNYDFNYVANDFTVTKARLTATADAQTKVYGEANPELTFKYSGFVNGEESIGSDPKLSTIADKTSQVGTYAINLEGASDDNYDFTYMGANLVISQAVLTATADDKYRSYKEENPDLTITYNGFKNDDDVSSLDKSVEISTGAKEDSDVGTYPIVVEKGSDENYDIEYYDGVLEIEKASQEITFDLRSSIIATEHSILLNVSSTSGLPVSCESSDTSVASVLGGWLMLQGAGTTDITASQDGNKNYVAAESVVNSIDVLGDEKLALSYKIYPVPCKDELHVDLDPKMKGKVLIEVVSVNGEKLLSQYFMLPQEIMFNVSNLDSGVYFLIIRKETGTITKRWIKM